MLCREPLTSIEINATHYRLQSPASFRKWADAAPPGFVFSVKGPRLVTNQKALAETGNFIERFLGSGLSELGDKLGPVLWQFAPFKRFDADDFGKFLDLLPRELDGRKLNHVIEARHASFATPVFIKRLRDGRSRRGLYRRRDLAEHRRRDGRRRLCAAAARGRQARSRLSARTSSTPGRRAPRAGPEGDAPDDLPLVDAEHKPAVKPRDVFVYFIHEGKLRAPAAAMALIERLA